jgi:DNA-binding beta-propeller fold protein YncE
VHPIRCARRTVVVMPKSLMAAVLFASATCSGAVAQPTPEPAAIETARAPDVEKDRPLGPPAPGLDAATGWLGTDAPISIADLRGQIVVIDFWTYCCINCMHTLPVLHELEQRFADQPVVVLGVHSAKFDGERDPQRIADAMARYGIEHPVAVDSEMAIWNAYDVHGWPTIAVIDSAGNLVGSASGEPELEGLTGVVEALLEHGRVHGTLASAPKRFAKKAAQQDGALSFPGKVTALQSGGLAIADSGHHRVLVVDRDGEVIESFGSGLAGWIDGSAGQAAFDDPQGIAASKDGNVLFVADTRSHVVRRIDRKSKQVTTIAGTGALGQGPLDSIAAPARATALRSPWDLALRGDSLFVALAGNHQIGVVDLKKGTVAALAGTGRETIADGAFADAAFAQPSGLALHGDTLFVADSETSSVRALDLRKKDVSTWVGTGLFDFGLQDGKFATARLQHPLALVWDGSGVVVADTYNGALRRLDPATRHVSTVVAAKSLRDPGGIALRKDGSFVVADTNAHRLVVFGAEGGEGTPIEIHGAPPVVVGRANATKDAGGAAVKIAAPGSAVKAGAVTIVFELRAPKDHEWSEGSPLDLSLQFAGATVWSHAGKATGGTSQTIDVATTASADASTLDLRLRGVVCDAVSHRYCQPIRMRFELAPPRIDEKAGAAKATYALEVALPEV